MVGVLPNGPQPRDRPPFKSLDIEATRGRDPLPREATNGLDSCCIAPDLAVEPALGTSLNGHADILTRISPTDPAALWGTLDRRHWCNTVPVGDVS